MKNQKVVLVIDTLIKLVVVIALIIAVETKQQYSYFTFLRWLVMATFLYFAYKAYDKKQIGILIYYGIVAVLFNPVHKFWFQKETWHLINYLVAIITLVIIIFDWTQKEKNKEVNIETKKSIMGIKTKIIISKEIVINLILIIITLIAFFIMYFMIKPYNEIMYILPFAFSYYAGYHIMGVFFKKEGIPLFLLDKLVYIMIPATIAGALIARIGYCFFYEPALLFNLNEIIKIWKGGFAYYGVVIAIFIALYFYNKKTGLGYWWLLDRIVFVLALAGVFIRIANLINFEIFDHTTYLANSFKYSSNQGNESWFPIQIYEAISYFIIFISLIWYYFKKDGKSKSGMTFGSFVIAFFIIRFIIVFLNIIQIAFDSQILLNMGLLMNIPFILAGIIIVILSSKNKL